MARPPRNNVDYFPFLCKEGRTMYFIEHKYNNDGFATWIKILRALAVTDYHFLQLKKETDLMYFSVKCLVKQETLNLIIDDLCEFEEFDKELWIKHKVIWCQKLIDSIQDAYKKRNNECFTKVQLLNHLGILKPIKSVSKPVKNNIDPTVNPQRREENIKKDKNIEEVVIDIETLKLKYLANTKLVDAMCNSHKMKLNDLKIYLQNFNLHLIQTENSEKSWKDYIKHFMNWMHKQPLKELKQSTSNIPIG